MPSERSYIGKITAEENGKTITIGGWVQDTRNLGGISFIQIRDRTGTMQVTVVKKKTDEALFEKITTIPRESVVTITGHLKENNQAKTGVELIPESADILNEAEAPLPLGVIDKVGADFGTRLNNRFMDLRKPEVEAIFEIRNAVVRGARKYFESNDFMEVATPKIVAAGAEGGATLFKLDYFDKKAYLAQSPQLYKQSLIGSGIDRLFEIAPAYRAEKSDTVRHLTEYSSMDVEAGFIESEEDVMNIVEGVVVSAIEEVKATASKSLELFDVDVEVPQIPFPRITFEEAVAFLKERGIELGPEDDLDTESEKALGAIAKEKYNADFYFITRFPTALKKETFYAMRDDTAPEFTRYFDLDYRGEEMVSGGQREHRYDVLVKQMEDIGADPENFEFYLKTFRYGMPPHGGFGLGVERFVHMMLKLPNIRECVLFPRDMYRLSP